MVKRGGLITTKEDLEAHNTAMRFLIKSLENKWRGKKKTRNIRRKMRNIRRFIYEV